MDLPSGKRLQFANGKMAIKIVDLPLKNCDLPQFFVCPMKNGDFPKVLLVYLRVPVCDFESLPCHRFSHIP